jgi:hypothetical protein
MTHEEVKNTLMTVAERLGVPCVILAAFIWLAREAAVSVNKTVVVPIVESHTEFLEATRDTLDRMCTTQESQARTLEELATGQNEIRSVLTTSGSRNFGYEPPEK